MEAYIYINNRFYPPLLTSNYLCKIHLILQIYLGEKWQTLWLASIWWSNFATARKGNSGHHFTSRWRYWWVAKYFHFTPTCHFIIWFKNQVLKFNFDLDLFNLLHLHHLNSGSNFSVSKIPPFCKIKVLVLIFYNYFACSIVEQRFIKLFKTKHFQTIWLKWGNLCLWLW